MNLKKLGLIAVSITAIALSAALYLYFFRAYREQPLNRLSISPKPTEQRAALVSGARRLKGILYDQSMGGFRNFFGKLGFPVCIDVPRIAYAAAGVDLDDLLYKDYKVHAQFYPRENGRNLPDTEFFVRRVRNLNAYCRANNKFIKDTMQPKPGDMVMSNAHIVMVSEVYPDGSYDIIENAPWTYMVVEYRSKGPLTVCRLLD